MRPFPFALLLLASGCERLDAIEAQSAPMVAQGLFLGVDLPAGVDIADDEALGQTSLCQVFLAQVTDPSELADSPVEGAELEVKSPLYGTLEFQDEGEGKYTVDASDGLVYEAGDEPVVSFEAGDFEGRLRGAAPEAPELDLPDHLVTFEDLRVVLDGDDYQNIVAAAYDLDRGNMTWTNLPEGVDEVYDFTHTEDAVDAIVIPGDAFRRKGTYVVGVAGMEIADPDDFEGVNTTLSAFMAGQFALALVTVDQAE